MDGMGFATILLAMMIVLNGLTDLSKKRSTFKDDEHLTAKSYTNQMLFVIVSRATLDHIFGISYLICTSPKTNMEPNTSWFVDVFPFPRDRFQLPC